MRFRILVLVLAAGLAPVRVANANPAGGAVQAGSATISGQGTGVVDVNQHSPSATLSWQSFNIKPGETTNFHQPGIDSIAVNRILDQNASAIFGALNANGNVYLINPNGILFGPGSQVNVGGLAAGTSYKAGQRMIEGGFDPSAVSNPGAAIVNEGTIRTREGGYVYLVAPKVENGSNGVIVAPGGEVSIAAGSTVHLTDRPDGRGVQIAYTAPGIAGSTPLKEVLGQQSFASLRSGALRQAGLVEANAVRERGGKIELYAENRLDLADTSRTSAAGAASGRSDGGTIHALSDDAAAVAPGATLDVSGGATRGAGGFVEVSAKNDLALSGTFKAAGTGGERGGQISFDPSVVEISGAQSFQGADSVKVTATEAIRLRDNASVTLASANGTPTYALHSGGDIVFGAGARIAETGGDAANHWNVQLVAGATDLSLAGLDRGTKNDGSAGGVYLGGGTGATGALTPGSGNGVVAMTSGDVTVRAAGDLRIGNDGGLRSERGRIDVEVGRDVRFSAGGKTTDGVIENGSGSVRVVAGRDVSLKGTGADGNAAIRTRGVIDASDPSRIVHANGGSILVVARAGDVDAGVGNRWLTPGPRSGDNPNADPLPVVTKGILGIGSEAGGDVTVIAGGDVRTDSSNLPRTGGTAFNSRSQNGDYTGAHIGLFGAGYIDAGGAIESIQAARANRLLVIAGGDIRGDYLVRHGRGAFRAGYVLANDVDPGRLDAASAPDLRIDPRALGAQIVRSAVAGLDPNRGWFGPLSRPVTIDVMDGLPLRDPADAMRVLAPTVDALGANGVAIRAIENPSLVYPVGGGQNAPVRRVASYGPEDSARLEAEVGDVVLVGNDIGLPSAEPNGTQQPPVADNVLVRLLPPGLQVVTHAWCPGCDRQRGLESRAGDFVMLNDFLLFPSDRAGLSLDVAGLTRTASTAARGPTRLPLEVRTVGSTALQSFTLPAGTLLVDPASGLSFTLASSLTLDARLPATAATGTILFRARPERASDAIEIPVGTRVSDLSGRIYTVLQNPGIVAAKDRLSAGQATFFAAPGQSALIDVPLGTRLVAPDGTVFETTAAATLLPRQAEITVAIRAVVGSPGRDVARYGLQLAAPLAGIQFATNRSGTSRPAEVAVSVQAVNPGIGGNVGKGLVAGLVDPIRGIEVITNPTGATGGSPAAPFGTPSGASAAPVAAAKRVGPIGRVAAGHRLQIVDPSGLPPGVSVSEIEIVAGDPGADTTRRPVVFRELRVRRENGQIVSTSVDPDPGEIELSRSEGDWKRDDDRSVATLKQSDASPALDRRAALRAFPAAYFVNYYTNCRSGVACSVDPNAAKIALGVAPTHLGDASPATLFSGGGFERIALDLAEAVTLRTDGNVTDLTLRTLHTAATEVSSILVPSGNASFGASSRTLYDTDPDTGRRTPVHVPDDAATGFQVAGPGSASVLVGVEAFSAADRNQDGYVTFDEFGASRAVFDSLDTGSLIPDGRLNASEAPWVPTGRGGSLSLQARGAAGEVLGIQTVGNLQGAALPQGGASLGVVASGDIALGDRGFLGTIQGGDLFVSSVGGGIRGGTPLKGTRTKRGIITANTAPGATARPASGSGGGAIRIDTFDDLDIGGLALAALSGSSILIESRGGSVIAGRGERFKNSQIAYDTGLREVTVSFEGSGIAALGGSIRIAARKNVEIGSGIFAANNVNVNATNVIAGAGAITSGGTTSFKVSGSIGGTVNAAGGISVSGGGTVSQNASLSSSGGVVSGAAGFSNSGTGRTSAETAKVANTSRESSLAGSGLGTGNGSGAGKSGPRTVMIQVSSRPCRPGECRS